MDAAGTAPHGMTNRRLSAWVDEMAWLCRPEQVEWVDGSEREYERLCAMMVKSGTFIRLNPDKRPNSFLACSHPSDVGRVAGLCMSFRSAWGRSARRSPRSACRSPIVPMSSST